MVIKDEYDLNIPEDMVLNDMDIAELSEIDINLNCATITYTINYAEDYLAEIVAERYNISEDKAMELIEQAQQEEK
jgi:DNA-binding transcriptional regulator LsrR (DeoR family)